MTNTFHINRQKQNRKKIDKNISLRIYHTEHISLPSNKRRKKELKKWLKTQFSPFARIRLWKSKPLKLSRQTIKLTWKNKRKNEFISCSWVVHAACHRFIYANVVKLCDWSYLLLLLSQTSQVKCQNHYVILIQYIHMEEYI